jgi:hypothetical protein
MMRLALVHAVAYPVLVWLVWVWLGIAERSAMALVGSALLAVFIVVALAWLVATAFDGHLRVRATWVRSLVFVVLLLGLITVKMWLGIAALILLPLLVLKPRLLLDWRYWAACVALAAVGGYLPWKLVTWVPAAKTLATQATSMGIRFSVAYVISVAALLLFASAVRRLAIPKSPSPAV